MCLTDILTHAHTHGNIPHLYILCMWWGLKMQLYQSTKFTQLTVTPRQIQEEHAMVSSHLFAEPAEMFDITAEWSWIAVVIGGTSAVAGRRQFSVHVRDGACRQWRDDVADGCQPLRRCVFVGTTQQTRAVAIRRVQLQCAGWLRLTSVRATGATRVAQSQWDRSLWRRRRRRLGIISPTDVIQQRRRRLAEVRSHLTQILHWQPIHQHPTSVTATITASTRCFTTDSTHPHSPHLSPVQWLKWWGLSQVRSSCRIVAHQCSRLKV